MAGFETVFGGTTIAPSNATFLLLALAADTDLQWPIEQAINGLVVADTIEVQASAPGLNVNLPDARQVSTGYTTLFNNTGGNDFTVRDANGGAIVAPVSGTAWVIYLADNSTEAGTWRVFQLGASVSVAVAAALAGPGLKAIATVLARDMPITDISTTPATLVDTDRAKFYNWTGGLGVLNLPAAGTVGNGWFIQLRNTGSGDLTVTPAAGTIDGAATKTFSAGSSAFVATDGTNWFTLGFGTGGSGGGSGFDFVEINVAGSGVFTLAGANLNRVAYRFTGVLTGDRTIVVPSAIQQYWVANATTGAFNLYVRTATQTPPGIQVLQNNQIILYCDGNNVINAESSTVSFPIPVAQGGTGATTAANARINLGGTATGIALFTALDAATARGVISAVSTARAINTGFGLSGGGDLSADRTLTTSEVVAVKTVTTARNTTTVPTADPELVVALGSAGTWEFEAVLVCGGDIGYTAGIRGGVWFSGTTNNPDIFNQLTFATISNGTNAAILEVASAGGSVSSALYPTGSSNPRMVTVKGTLNVSTAGNLSIPWSQSLSSGTDAWMMKGSYLIARKIT